MFWFCLIFSANSRQSGAGDLGSWKSSALTPAHERLKPPVSAINMERKVIKLGGSKITASSLSSNDQDYHRLKQPAITESNSVLASCRDSRLPSANSSQKIRLGQSEQVPVSVSTAGKNDSQAVVDVSANVVPAKRASDISGETEKKKFKATAITWP